MVESIGEYGLKLGLAFQIIDDVLDVTGDPAEMGKATQKDAQIGKLTYPAILGLEQTRQQGDAYIAEALAAIEQLGSALEPLRQLAIMAGNRRK